MVKKDKKGVAPPFFLIFSDLDDTLLDHDNYEWEKAKPALEYCIKSEVPVILVSSKTRAEIEVIHRTMKLSSPFISENGGGIFFPEGAFPELPDKAVPVSGDFYRLTLGTAYNELTGCLSEIESETGIRVKGFSQMTQEEVSKLTGLSLSESRLALMREFDEPFIILEREGIDKAPLHDAASRRGLRISEGGRFFHLHGQNDKGTAVKILVSLYENKYGLVFAIALGDSPNDFGMFEMVNQAVLVKSERSFPGIKDDFPGIIITDQNGPGGWNSAVLGLLIKKKGVLSDV